MPARVYFLLRDLRAVEGGNRASGGDSVRLSPSELCQSSVISSHDPDGVRVLVVIEVLNVPSCMSSQFSVQ